jgi:SAM-dependent methyltransferase
MSDFEKEYYEAESHWEGENLQDPANQERIRFTAEMIPQDVTNLIDIGCGNGVFVNYLTKHKSNLQLMAIDRSRTALKYVQTEKKEGDISQIPAADRSYDCVTCLEVIEHLPLQVYEKALEELTRIAGRYVIISVPYREVLEQSHTQCPACRSIFNYELHLRNFSDETMLHLLDKYGFSCVGKHHLGMSFHYKGYHTFRRIFYREQFRQWKSPICPICGYHERIGQLAQAEIVATPARAIPKRKLISYFTGLPKLLWPKEKKFYWVIGLYERN